MSDDKERTVELGCVTWFIAIMLISALWSIGTRLSQVVVQLKIANCLTEAAHGITCPDAERGK
jgi:hypothetical protein